MEDLHITRMTSLNDYEDRKREKIFSMIKVLHELLENKEKPNFKIIIFIEGKVFISGLIEPVGESLVYLCISDALIKNTMEEIEKNIEYIEKNKDG